MSYRTELMEEILTSESAKKIVQYVSPIYGDAYAMLWLFQCIGIVLDETNSFPEEYKNEITPATAKWTIELWETEYGIPHDSTLSLEQRQNQILQKMKRKGPMNPLRLEGIVSNLSGYNTLITENIAKNTFLIKIQGYLTDLSKVIAAVDDAKPAHLIYEILMATLMQVEFTAYWGMAQAVKVTHHVNIAGIPAMKE